MQITVGQGRAGHLERQFSAAIVLRLPTPDHMYGHIHAHSKWSRECLRERWNEDAHAWSGLSLALFGRHMNRTISSKAISEVEDAELKGKCCCASPFSQSFSVSLIACHGMTLLS